LNQIYFVFIVIPETFQSILTRTHSPILYIYSTRVYMHATFIVSQNSISSIDIIVTIDRDNK